MKEILGFRKKFASTDQEITQQAMVTLAKHAGVKCGSGLVYEGTRKVL